MLGKIDAPLKGKLQNIEWGEYKTDDLFKVLPIRNKLSKLDLSDSGNIPVYSSDTTNNGIMGFTSKKADYKVSDNIPIYLIFGDHTRTMNIATSDFCVMDNVKVLIPFTGSTAATLFICTVWKKTIPNLGYSRHWSIAKESILTLPTSDGVNPDFEFMESFVSELEAMHISKLEAYLCLEMDEMDSFLDKDFIKVDVGSQCLFYWKYSEDGTFFLFIEFF